MLPAMTIRRELPNPDEWVTGKLPDGRMAKITTREVDGERLVIIVPTGREKSRADAQTT